jgi:hypothetical protein
MEVHVVVGRLPRAEQAMQVEIEHLREGHEAQHEEQQALQETHVVHLAHCPRLLQITAPPYT